MVNKVAYAVVGLILNLTLFVFSSAQWWKRSTLPYNESGRYFDKSTGIVWHEYAVTAYIALSLGSGLLLAFFCYRIWKGFRK